MKMGFKGWSKWFNSVPFTLACVSSIGLLLVEVSGDHSSICFRPPVVAKDKEDEWEGTRKYVGLGITKLQELLPESSKEFWKYWRDPNEEKHVDDHLMPDIKLTINLYSLHGTRPPYSKDKLGSGVMDGWFRVDIDNDINFQENVKGFVLWVEDEGHETVGEWVTNTEFGKVQKYETCPPNDLTEFMSISCGGADRFQPIVSNTVVYLNNPEAIPEMARSDQTALTFYLRIYGGTCVYWGEVGGQFVKYFWIRLRAAIKGYDGLVDKAYELSAAQRLLIGAPDPMPTNDNFTVECNKPIPVFSSAPNKQMYSNWVGGTRKDPIFNDNEGKGLHHDRYYGCQGYLFDGRCKNVKLMKDNEQDFIDGTSIKNKQNTAKRGTPMHCGALAVNAIGPNQLLRRDTDTSNPSVEPDKLPKYQTVKYDTYLDGFKSDPARMCDPKMVGQDPTDPSKPCTESSPVVEKKKSFSQPHPRRKAFIKKFQDLTNNEDPEWPTEEDEGVVFDNDRGLYITRPFVMLWYMRKAHGIVMVISTLFIIPLSIFISRYYKESFMSRRIFFFRLWYQFHTHSTGWLFAFMITGLVIAFICRDCFGRSLSAAADAHQAFAFFSFLGLFMVFFGNGLRSHIMWFRDACILCHWMWGVVLYVANIIGLYTAIYIPGSAMANIDASIPKAEQEKFPVAININVIIISVWVIIDVCFHTVMSVLMCVNDKKMDIVAPPRKYNPVPIPVIRESEKIDATGAVVRTVFLILYASFSFICTVVALGVITNASTIQRGFGKLYCTHNDYGNVSYLPDLRYECADYEHKQS